MRIFAIRKELNDLQDKVVSFSEPIGWSSIAWDSSDRIATAELNEGELKAYLDHWARTLAGWNAGTFRRWEEAGAPAERLTLTRLFEALEERVSWYDGEIARLNAEIAGFQGRETTALEQLRNEDNTLTTEIEGPTGRIREFKSELSQNFANRDRYDRELRDLVQDMQAQAEEYERLRSDHQRTEAELRREFDDLTRRMNAIVYRQQLAEERRDPDGLVLAVDDKLQIVWIDVTHADRLFRGTKFKVYSLRKGGEKVDKGEIEVVEVGKDRSKAAVVSLLTEDPIYPEDRVYNSYFERGTPRRIAFAGRFTGKLSNQEAERALREFGDQVQARVDENTDFVVVGEGFETHPNFESARVWGVKILLERYLYEYLGIP